MEKYLSLIKSLYVNNGEYDFEKESDAEEFAKGILYKAQRQYNDEGFYHKYEEFKEFLYTYRVERIAFWLYEEKYSA